MAIGTLLVDHATPVRSVPSCSTGRPLPRPETASPCSPPSDASSLPKLARSSADRIPVCLVAGAGVAAAAAVPVADGSGFGATG